MTKLEKIVKEAQKLRKAHPKKYAKWTDYIKAASKSIAGYTGTKRNGATTTVNYTRKTTVKKSKPTAQSKLFGMKKNRYHIVLDNLDGDSYAPFSDIATKVEAISTMRKWAIPKAIERYNKELSKGHSVVVYVYDNQNSAMIIGYSLKMKGKKIVKTKNK